MYVIKERKETLSVKKLASGRRWEKVLARTRSRKLTLASSTEDRVDVYGETEKSIEGSYDWGAFFFSKMTKTKLTSSSTMDSFLFLLPPLRPFVVFDIFLYCLLKGKDIEREVGAIVVAIDRLQRRKWLWKEEGYNSS